MPRPFRLVDVFHERPPSGNPLAVVHDASGMDDAAMLALTRWLNLSESTFLLPPESPAADYRVRIFTLDGELPFAGHPTLGSCHAWLEAGGTPRSGTEVVQECGAGLVRIRRGSRLAFAAPPLLRSGPVDEVDLAEVAKTLRVARGDIIDAQWADNGPGWIAVMLRSARAVLALDPETRCAGRTMIGVVGAHEPGTAEAFEVRAFFTDPARRLIEDPVTGSFNAALAQWLYASGRIAGEFTAAQGTRLGRHGRLYLSRDAMGTVWVGGDTTSLVTGHYDA